jgi:hypothetical protein
LKKKPNKPDARPAEGPEASRRDKAPDKKPREISDLLFLDTIRDALYEMLASGAIELKLDSGFKAIELKHKISDESQYEKLFLELINELRSQEINKGDGNESPNNKGQ